VSELWNLGFPFRSSLFLEDGEMVKAILAESKLVVMEITI
jgi:hypothetical protein